MKPEMKINVALHTEGVDRNNSKYWLWDEAYESPSTRRAWIEIVRGRFGSQYASVALHTEGVDRNSKDVTDFVTSISRPPHGGRG